MPNLSSLPYETLQHIAHYARVNDTSSKQAYGTSSTAKGSDTDEANPKEKRQLALYEKESVLSLGLCNRPLWDTARLIYWRSLDFTEINPCSYSSIRDLLIHKNYGTYIRQFQLSIALTDPTLADDNQGASSSVSIRLAVELLNSMPLLDSLEIDLLALSEERSISSIPKALLEAIASHGKRLRHFGISCEGAATTRSSIRLDENLVADLVNALPNLDSLTLHRIGFDTSSPPSTPLLDSISSLDRLEKLDILDVQAINETSSSRPFSGRLKELNLVLCSRLSPTALDSLLYTHRETLRDISLVNTPASHHPSLSSSAMKTKYNLPNLRTLHIENDTGHVDTISYLERFSKTPLEKLSIRYAAGIQLLEIYSLIARKELKCLSHLSLGLFGLPGTKEEDLRAVTRRTEQYGVVTTIDGKSSLIPDMDESSITQ